MKLIKNFLATALCCILLLQLFNIVIVYSEFPTEYWTAGSNDEIISNEYNQYEVRTPKQLAWIASVVNGTITTGAVPDSPRSISIVLMNDIDMGGKLWIPIGTSTRSFIGQFNGSNYTINNLTINTTNNNQGLFGYFEGNGLYVRSIQNVNITNANIIGGEGVGALAGISSGHISNCHSTGTIMGKSLVGGLVGSITSSLSSGIGGSFIGSIFQCSSSCNVIGCGIGTIGGTGAGGLIGFNAGSVTSSFATGNISSNSTSGYGFGGLIGMNFAPGRIENCYARGNINCSSIGISFDSSASGLVGFDAGNVIVLIGATRTTIKNCYSTGTVIGVENSSGFLGYGYSGSDITDCYYDKQASGQTSGIGGGGTTGTVIGKTTNEMKEFDFQFLLNTRYNLWIRYPKFNDGYPVLDWQIQGLELYIGKENDMSIAINHVSYHNLTAIIDLYIPNNSIPADNIVWFVAKDKNGKLLKISKESIISDKNEIISFNLEMSEDTEMLELYIWDSNSLEPYTNKIIF